LPLLIVAVSDFSGLTSSACALASAAASAATDSLHLGMFGLRREKIEAYRPRLRALPSHSMPDRLPDILRHQCLELVFRPLMVRKASRVLRNSAANSAQEFDALVSTMRIASMRGRGASALIR